MAEVNDFDVRIDTEDDAFHGANKVIREAEIRGQSNYGSARQESPVWCGESKDKLIANLSERQGFVKLASGPSSKGRSFNPRTDAPANK